ncbi:MAG: response regulator [Steroidobacteraceae bacterium]|nr:response regulator [Steroidobacteraceae bacterium]
MARTHEHVRARYNALMHQCEDVTLFANDKGNIEAVSRSVLPVLGFQPAELARKPVKQLIPAHCVLEHPFDVVSKGVACTDGPAANAEVRDAKGRTMTLTVRVHAFCVSEAVHYAIHLRKPSPMQAASAAPERATSIAPSAHRSRDLFIATMSHELRTPLHGLIATLDMMRADQSCPPQFQQRLSIARLSARALLRIANDILDLTRIDSGHFSLEQRPFSLQRLIAEVIEESRARAESLGLTLQHHAGALPASCTGDPARIKQILSNLLSNALQHTQSGGITLKVDHTGTQCTIDVIDTGSGIPKDKWQVIFDPFVQVSSGRKRRASGTGLGLAISRRLAEAMGGSLTLVSSSPAGSTFRLNVPLPGSDEAAPNDQSLRVFNNPRGRVLVVEDNAANRYVTEALLSNLECPVTLVESGEDALELLQTADFDLILMDCQMPGLDGCETTRRIRRMLTRRIPIIAMTADALPNHRQACLEAGMDDFLPKPFGRQALHEMLCKWLAPQSAAASVSTELAARVASLPVLDDCVFQELWAGLQWRIEPLRNIRSSLAQSARKTVKLLQKAASLDEAGRKALQRQLHTLVGSAGMVGAKQVEFVSRTLQGIVRAGAQQAVEAELALLTEAIRHFEIEIDHRIEHPPTYRETATVSHSCVS